MEEIKISIFNSSLKINRGFKFDQKGNWRTILTEETSRIFSLVASINWIFLFFRRPKRPVEILLLTDMSIRLDERMGFFFWPEEERFNPLKYKNELKIEIETNDIEWGNDTTHRWLWLDYIGFFFGRILMTRIVLIELNRDKLKRDWRWMKSSSSIGEIKRNMNGNLSQFCWCDPSTRHSNKCTKSSSSWKSLDFNHDITFDRLIDFNRTWSWTRYWQRLYRLFFALHTWCNRMIYGILSKSNVFTLESFTGNRSMRERISSNQRIVLIRLMFV